MLDSFLDIKVSTVLKAISYANNSWLLKYFLSDSLEMAFDDSSPFSN